MKIQTAKPVAIATLFVVAALMLALSMWWTLRAEVEVIDRITFEGRGGQAQLVGHLIVPVPDLEAAAGSDTQPLDQLLALRGGPLSSLRTLMPSEPLQQDLGGGLVALVWASACNLPEPEPGQWPVAHVCAVVRAPFGSAAIEALIEQVAVIGSLGRVIAANPDPSLNGAVNSPIPTTDGHRGAP